MRWSTVSTERWPAIASTASLMARTAPLDRSLIAGSTIGRARPGCIGRGAETGLGPSTQASQRPSVVAALEHEHVAVLLTVQTDVQERGGQLPALRAEPVHSLLKLP